MATRQTPTEPESGYKNKRRWNKNQTQPPIPSPRRPTPQAQSVPQNHPNQSNLPAPIRPYPSAPNMPPAQTIDGLLSGQLSKATQKAHRQDLERFLTFLGFKPTPGMDNDAATLEALCRVTRITATEYRDYMLNVKKLSATTINRYMSTISGLYEILKEEGLISKSPFHRIRRPRVSREGRTPALSREQTEKILLAPDTTSFIGRRDRALLLLLYFTGLRRSEIVKVSAEDFREHNGHILLAVHGKGRSDKSDTVKIPQRIWPEIKAFIEENGEGYLFRSQSRNEAYNLKEGHISPTRAYLLFRHYAKKALGTAYSIHSSRVTFLTLALSVSDVRSVMYAARHADPATTIRYDRQRLNLEKHPADLIDLDLGQTPTLPSSSSSSTSS